jgi:protein O-mannosyl-transferase
MTRRTKKPKPSAPKQADTDLYIDQQRAPPAPIQSGHPSEKASARGMPRIRRVDWLVLACFALLAAGTVAIYLHTFDDPLIQDDAPAITDNPSIRRLWPIWPVLSPPSDAPVAGRPLLSLSYALNYAAGGTAVSGYHAVNLLIHVLAAWTLFALVRRTLLVPTLVARFGSAATPLALVVSALWAWHPLQTESVTYISQRAESLMGLFYLATLYCFARAAEANSRRARSGWFSLSVAALLAGVASKEVIITAPLLVLLYDRSFVSGNFRDALRRHWGLYAAMAAACLPLAFRVVNFRHVGVGYASGIAWWAYGLTECRVIARYLLLSVWPRPLVFDYGWYEPSRLAEVWPYALLLVLVLAGTAISLRRAPALGFAACWFLLILAPTSSVIPIYGQSMAENRMYLPLAGVVAAAVLGAFAAAGRWSLLVLGAVAVGLGAATVRRNEDYASELAIWADTVAKCPFNVRAHNNLGLTLEKIPGRRNDAIAQFEEALRLKEDYPEAHYNLGNSLAKTQGRLNDAIAQYDEALRLKPDFGDAHNNLGTALLNLPGRLNDAIAHLEEARRLKPDNPEVHNDLGNALFSAPGRLRDAIAQYEEALRLRPDYPEAHYNLGNALFNAPGRLKDAVAQYEEALRLKPDYPEAHNSLGIALERVPGRLGDAIAQYEEALRLRPDFAAAHNNLGDVWFGMPGRLNDAVGQFEAALRLEPNSAEVLVNLGTALDAMGRTQDAISRFEAALRQHPGFALAHYRLGGVLLRLPGRLDDAAAQFESALRVEPNNAAAHYKLALALLRMPGRREDARAQLELVLRLQPGNESARKLMASLGTPAK